jgi:hypothetical protein
MASIIRSLRYANHCAKRENNKWWSRNTARVRKSNYAKPDKIGVIFVDDKGARSTKHALFNELHPSSLVVINKDENISNKIAKEHNIWHAPLKFEQASIKLSQENNLYSVYADVCQAYTKNSAFRNGVNSFLHNTTHKYVVLALTSSFARRNGGTCDEAQKCTVKLVMRDIQNAGYVRLKSKSRVVDYKGYGNSTRMLFIGMVLKRC